MNQFIKPLESSFNITEVYGRAFHSTVLTSVHSSIWYSMAKKLIEPPNAPPEYQYKVIMNPREFRTAVVLLTANRDDHFFWIQLADQIITHGYDNGSVTILEPTTRYEKYLMLARSMAYHNVECLRDGNLEESKNAIVNQRRYLEMARESYIRLKKGIEK